MSQKNNLRERLLQTVETAKRYYIDQSDGRIYQIDSIAKDKEKKDYRFRDLEYYNLQLAFISYVTSGKHLLLGDPGAGKTSLAILVSSLLGSTPPHIVSQVLVKGTPDISEADVKGRLHYGRLTKEGVEFVIWAKHHLFPFLNIDEVQRIPTAKQSYFLQGLEDGSWECHNQSIYTGKKPGFITMNELDSGSFEITQALMERLTVCTEHNHLPWCLQSEKDAVNVLKEKELSHREIEDMMRDTLGEVELPYKQKLEKINSLRERYRKEVLASIDTLRNPLTDSDLEKIAQEIGNVPLIPDADFFGMWLEACYNESEKYGVKRMSDPVPQSDVESVDANYAVGWVYTPQSNRAQPEIMKYAKGIAWLNDYKEVDVDLLYCVAVNVLAHRMKFTEGFSSKKESEYRDDMRCIAFTKGILESTAKDFGERKGDFRSVIHKVMNGEELNPREKKLLEDRHPLMRAAKKRLEERKNK